MGNPFGNIGNIMKQAKEMQQKLKEMQDSLGAMHIVGEAGGGMVKLLINGNGEALSIKIDDAVYNEQKIILQGLIVAAINDARQKLEVKKKEAMTGLMGNMGLPPGFDLSNLTGES